VPPYLESRKPTLLAIQQRHAECWYEPKSANEPATVSALRDNAHLLAGIFIENNVTDVELGDRNPLLRGTLLKSNYGSRR